MIFGLGLSGNVVGSVLGLKRNLKTVKIRNQPLNPRFNGLWGQIKIDFGRELQSLLCDQFRGQFKSLSGGGRYFICRLLDENIRQTTEKGD